MASEEENRIRFWAAGLVSLLLLLGMFGCNRQEAGVPLAEQTGKPAYGDTIIEASIGEPSTLLPVLASDSASSDINGLVYDGLLRYEKPAARRGHGRRLGDLSRQPDHHLPPAQRDQVA